MSLDGLHEEDPALLHGAGDLDADGMPVHGLEIGPVPVDKACEIVPQDSLEGDLSVPLKETGAELAPCHRLLIFFKMILLPQGFLRLFVLVGEEVLPTRAEADVPMPEAAEDAPGVLIVVCTKLTVLARVG